LIHGDLKLANLGVEPAKRLIMLDWALVGFMSPFIDLGWFLAVNSAKLPVSKETVIDLYRAQLSESDVDLGSEWVRHLEIGLLGGGTLRLGWAKAFGALAEDEQVRSREAAELDWWCDLAERASRWLE
jgi:aminoglycoside phosphotransferase (APT) family kinase protein